MRLRLPRGRSVLVLAVLVCAMAVPATVTAAGSGRVVPSVDPIAAPETTGGQSPEIFLVELEDDAATFRKQAKSVGLKFTERFEYKRLFHGVSVRISPNDVGKLAGIGSVSQVYPARYFSLGPTSLADPELATAIKMTGADLAQAAGFTGDGVKVAVIDSGVDLDHPDLGGDGVAGAPHANSRVGAGFDLVGDTYEPNPESPGYQPTPQPDPVPDDCNGHGTHVSGIIGANGDSPSEARGVAPGVTFGAYRVFGCAGSTTGDIMIAAMEMALADGMDVLNMSIGDPFNNWAETPTAAAADALVDAGMVVVASIGNNGLNGIYSAGAPGVGNKVIGVASHDNSHIQAPGFTITPDNLAIPYTDSSSLVPTIPDPPDPPTSGTFEIKETADAALIGPVPPNTYPGDPPGAPGGPDFADGCSPHPPGFFAGKIALIRRGVCTFTVKAENAEDAGAVAVVLYNNQPGAFGARVEATPQVAIPVVSILQAHGELIHNRLSAGPVSLTWQAQVTVPNPSGGLVSSFSSYGTEATLTTKPDIGAPGGLIRSTWPLEKGAYTTISGTSMSSPHVAGAAALFLDAHPGTSPVALRTALQNSADPADWFGAPRGSGLIEPVHRQGAGMVDIDDAIAATTTISPGKLSLGEGTAHAATLTLHNASSALVTYDLEHLVAISTGTVTFGGPAQLDFWLPDTQVVFSSPSVTVPAGGDATVGVTITADPDEAGIPTGGLYGGYLLFVDPDDEDVVHFRVPYTGFKGDYQSIVALTNSPVIGKQNAPFIAGDRTYVAAPAGEVWTLANPAEVPNVLIHFNHQVRRLELQVVDAATGKPIHPVFANFLEREFLPRNETKPPAGGPYADSENVLAFPWDGTRMHDNGKGTPDHRKVVPDGQYKIVVKALKAGGDPGNPAHWETQTTGTITIDRP